ncbi:hypothetical protein QQ045_026451 [Rhodiola kirilowii]
MEIENGDSAAGPAIIKALASCNKPSRDRALRLLQKWLPRQSKVADDDMKKIWKGLFYCAWHADKFPAQSELIERLTSLLLALDLPVSIHYFNVFLLTMRREWAGIDSLRLEKFYLLIRRFVSKMFELMRRNGWDLELCKRLVCVLEQGTFLAEDKYLGNGVNYHVASLFVDELKPFWPVKIEVVEVLIQPFVSILGKTTDKILVSKIKSSVFDVLAKAAEGYLKIKKLGKDGEEGDGESGEVSFGVIGLKLDLASKLFELGSSVNCVQGNRKVLFALSDEFGKLDRDLKSSGIEIKVPEVENDVAEEVPRLVAMSVDGEGEQSDGLGDQAVVAVDSNGFSEGKLSKKERKALKKLRKKMKLKMADVLEEDIRGVESDRDLPVTDGENSNAEPSDEVNTITLNESALSNLQMQFEKVAAEAGLEDNGASVLGTFQVDNDQHVTKKKRKRSKSKDANNGIKDEGGDAATNDGDKSAKKVRFSMKNNLVWKPQTPLPPQSVRIPPSVTPRGSALKKGVSPGPIRDTSSQSKKLKRSSSGKKRLKGIKSPGIKRPKKLKNTSL